MCWTDFFEPILPSIGKVNTASYKMKFWLVNGEGSVFALALVCFLNFIRVAWKEKVSFSS